MEHVVVGGFQLVEDEQATCNNHAHLQSDASGQYRTQRGTLQHQCAGTVHFELHQCLPGSIRKTCCDLCFIDAKACEVIQRQVDAADVPVLRHILPEVDELQGGADGVGIGDIYRCGFLVEV